jgi:NAD(P)-dependent dehydrogenase (short-subunit alcohol dehydrogenase family)
MERIEGRIAMVTGAGSGIGLAISNALLAAGARVVLTDIDAMSLGPVVSQLGPSASALRLDVTSRDDWSRAKEVTEASIGPVEILVNNAGLAPDWNELADMPPAHFDQLVAIMLTGVFNGVHAFAGNMRDRGEGHVVNISSMIGLIGAARQGAYAAAKFGVVGLTEALRAEMQPHGIGVSVVCPGRVRSNLLAGNGPSHLDPDEGMDPSVVADQVLRAIRQNDLYVITHSDHKSLIADRAARLLDAFDRVSSR